MHRHLKNALAVTLVVCGTAAGLAQEVRAQQHYPSKPVRLVVSASAGGVFDTISRMMGQKMSESWGQPVVVENRPGAGGTLAANMVAKAAPDGYTILFVGTNFPTSAAMQPSLPYHPLKDFAGVSHIGSGTLVVVVTPDLGVRSVNELIALAKARPSTLIYSSGAAGSGNHLSGIRLNLAAGIKVITVAFKGAQEATIEVLAGRAQYSVMPLGVVLPFIKDGKLMALATVPERVAVLPEVPALAETLPEFSRPETSMGLLAPARTPTPVLNQISREVARILGLPDIKERLHGMGVVAAPTGPEAYDRILRMQIELLSKLVKEAGLRTR